MLYILTSVWVLKHYSPNLAALPLSNIQDVRYTKFVKFHQIWQHRTTYAYTEMILENNVFPGEIESTVRSYIVK